MFILSGGSIHYWAGENLEHLVSTQPSSVLLYTECSLPGSACLHTWWTFGQSPRSKTSGLNTVDMAFHVECHICHSEDHGDCEEPVLVVGNELGSRRRHYRLNVHLAWHLLPRVEHPGACLQDSRTFPQVSAELWSRCICRPSLSL